MEPFMGEVKMFGGNFAPRGYASCNGQLLTIAQNSALFSILGNTFGGNGQTNFGLPNLQGRMPVHYGQGPGLPAIALGQVFGQPSATMNVNQMPAHSHTMTVTVNVMSAAGNSRTPQNAYIAGDAGGDANYAPAGSTPTDTMAPGAVALTIAPAGGGQPIPTVAPGLGVNFIIALQGIFPSRN